MLFGSQMSKADLSSTPKENFIKPPILTWRHKHCPLQNGYGGRSRNLVDDAKFESRVHDEEKQNIIDTVKRQSSIHITGEFFRARTKAVRSDSDGYGIRKINLVVVPLNGLMSVD